MDKTTRRRRTPRTDDQGWPLPDELTAPQDAPQETPAAETAETPRAPLTGAELHARAQASRAQLQQDIATIDAEISAKRGVIASMQEALQHEAASLEQERLAVAAVKADERRLATRLRLVAGTGDEADAVAERGAAIDKFQRLELAYDHRRALIETAKAENAEYLDGLRQVIAELGQRRSELEQTDTDLAAEETAAHERAGREALAAERAHHAELSALLEQAQHAVATAQGALDVFYAGVPEHLAAWPERIADGVDITPWQPSPGAEAFRLFTSMLNVLLQNPAALAGLPVFNTRVSIERPMLFSEDELRAILLRADGRQVIVQHLAMARDVLERLEPIEQTERERRAAAAAQ